VENRETIRILSCCNVELVAVPADKWVLASVFIRHLYIYFTSGPSSSEAVPRMPIMKN